MSAAADELQWNEAAEESCLGLALSNPRAAERVAATLQPGDFFKPSHGALFETIAQLVSAGEDVDPIIIAERLRGEPWYGDLGGATYLHSLCELPALVGHLEQYIAIVKKHSRERRKHQIADDLAEGRTDEAQTIEALQQLVADPASPSRLLDILTATELRDFVSPHIDWIIERMLAKGVLTIIGGKPKCGKTTFLFGGVYAIQAGVPFMGLKTTPSKVLYITEQNRTTIRPKLDEYGLLDCEDLHVMFPRQMLGMTWSEIIDQAATYCEANGITVVIVDTVNDLCHLENTFSDTEWIAALDPLQRLAQHGGMAVLASFHAKKELASLVDMFRGSNAIVGKADTVIGLWRDGSGDETTRTIEGMSRLDNGFDERTRIVREGREYVTAGVAREIELEAKLKDFLAVLPIDRDVAMTRQEIAENMRVSPATVSTYIKSLKADGRVLEDTRPGRGNTKIYWAVQG